MGKYHRASRRIENFQGAALADVRGTDNHAYALHLREDLATEVSESTILILTAAGQCVVAVIGEEHPANSQVVVQRYHAELIVEAAATFDVETDPELVVLTSLLDVCGTKDQVELI